MAGVIKKIKMARNWFGRICVVFFYISLVFVVRQSSPCFAYVDLLKKRVRYAIDDIYGDVCKVVSDFGGSIGS